MPSQIVSLPIAAMLIALGICMCVPPAHAMPTLNADKASDTHHVTKQQHLDGHSYSEMLTQAADTAINFNFKAAGIEYAAKGAPVAPMAVRLSSSAHHASNARGMSSRSSNTGTQVSNRGPGDDYNVAIQVGDGSALVTLDTGSTKFAVAGKQFVQGAPVYYPSPNAINTGVVASNSYVSGSWSGYYVRDTVVLTSPTKTYAFTSTFGNITQQVTFFNTEYSSGITGLGFPCLACFCKQSYGPNCENYWKSIGLPGDMSPQPLVQTLYKANTGVTGPVGLYLCPVQPGTMIDNSRAPGYYTFVDGDKATGLYQSSIAWAKVVAPGYFAINIQNVELEMPDGTVKTITIDNMPSQDFFTQQGRWSNNIQNISHNSIFDSGWGGYGSMQDKVALAIMSGYKLQGCYPILSSSESQQTPLAGWDLIYQLLQQGTLPGPNYCFPLSKPIQEWPHLRYYLQAPQSGKSSLLYVSPDRVLTSVGCPSGQFTWAPNMGPGPTSNVFGNQVQSQYMMFFDHANERVGWAQPTDHKALCPVKSLYITDQNAVPIPYPKATTVDTNRPTTVTSGAAPVSTKHWPTVASFATALVVIAMSL